MSETMTRARAKFTDPVVTATGEARAHIALKQLDTLWINTGTLCNLTCANCYIESSPRNDRLVYISAAEVAAYLDEIQRDRLGTQVIGFTGGEPFMNRDFLPMLEDTLARGFETLVLTNAMRPMQRHKDTLLALKKRFGTRLRLRVSVDHYSREVHERERGKGSWEPTLAGLAWLSGHGFTVTIAGRRLSGEDEAELRAGYAVLIAELGLLLDALNPDHLILFPEMDARTDVPEITESCWGILGVDPDTVMCATSRMVVKRKGAPHPAVVACTLLPYDPQFELGRTLKDAACAVSLNHPHCAQFCVLGGASCGGA